MYKKIAYLVTVAIVISLIIPVGAFAGPSQPQVFNLTIIHKQGGQACAIRQIDLLQ